MATFQSLGLPESILTAIQELGFEEPTPIQEQSISALLKESTDLIGLAQTGTGKTAAFGLPLLSYIDTNSDELQGLILSPTRELCVQIAGNIKKFAKNMRNLKSVEVYGGADISRQIRAIRAGAQIIVATPGRLMDLMERKVIKLDRLKYVILDEADEMLNMGFKEDIDHILSFTPEEKKIWLFSATMPNEIRDIIRNFMHNPVEISIGKQNTTNLNISHQYAFVEESKKYETLKRFVDINSDMYGIVFCRTKAETQDIAERLISDGYNADSLHGDLSQAQRDRVMKAFKSKNLQMLIATDVAARGIDVDNITHVFHMNLPHETEYYTHRAGRTGRIGNKGISIAIISKKENRRLKDIERFLKTEFESIKVPSGKDICQTKIDSIADKIISTEVDQDKIGPYFMSFSNKLEALTKFELIEKILSIEGSKVFDYYSKSRDVNQSDDGKKGKAGVDYRRFFINVGKKDGLDTGRLIDFIATTANISGEVIGRIDLKDTYSFFEIEIPFVQAVVESVSGCMFEDRKVRLDETTAAPERGDRGGFGGGDRGRSRGGFGGGGRGERSGGGGFGGGRSRSYSGGGDRGGYSSDRGGDRPQGGDRGGYSSDRGGDRPQGGDRGNYGGGRAGSGDRQGTGGGRSTRDRSFGGGKSDRGRDGFSF